MAVIDESDGRGDRSAPRGVRYVAAADPAAKAEELAASDGGRIVDRPDVDAAVRELVEAGEWLRDAGVSTADRFTLEATAARPPIDEELLDELRRMAGEVGRADRIRSNTELSVAETVTRRLSRNTGLAVHPSSLRAAAAALVDTDKGLEQAEAAIADLGDRPGHSALDGSGVEMPQALPSMLDEDALDAAQTRRRAIAIGVAILVPAAIAIAVGAPIWVLPLGVVLALAVAMVIVRRGAAAREDASARRQASASLDLVTATAAKADQAAAQLCGYLDEWSERVALLEADRDRALGAQRAARRAWDALAGPDANPYDLDSVIQARDPQYAVGLASLATSPTIRTANAFHRKALARWKVAWASVGWAEPPDAEAVEGALADLEAQDEQRRRATAAVEVLGRLDEALILVDPFADRDDEQKAGLERDLGALPEGALVTIVRLEKTDYEND